MALAAKAGGQSFRRSSPPSFLKVVSSSSCLSLMVSWGLSTAGESVSNFFNSSGEGVASGTTLAACTWVMIFPLARRMGLEVMFLTTTVTHRLPGSRSV